ILYLHGCYLGNNPQFMKALGERSPNIKEVCGWTGVMNSIEIANRIWITWQEGDMECVNVNEGEACFEGLH
ncbi:hypothetical protein ACFL02_06885, partial [Planctomycetota bacterium]